MWLLTLCVAEFYCLVKVMVVLTPGCQHHGAKSAVPLCSDGALGFTTADECSGVAQPHQPSDTCGPSALCDF